MADLLVVSRTPDGEGENVMSDEEKRLAIQHLEEKMLECAGRLDFEEAAKYRDKILALKGEKVDVDKTPAGRRPTRKRRRK